MNEKTFKTLFIPKLEGDLSREEIPSFDNVIVGGIGGSGLAARILFFLDPTFPVWLHDDYDLPVKNSGATLYVAISYSGNTAETLSFAMGVLSRKQSLIIITSGGLLLDLAIEKGIGHIIIPSGFEPRDAVHFMLRALLYIIDREDLFPEPKSSSLDIHEALDYGNKIGEQLERKIPLIYSSRNNYVLAYIWKIMLNETGKIPAFANYFPELAHNEVQGIVPETAGPPAENLKVLLLLDEEDNPKLLHEMNVFRDLALSNSINVISLNLPSGKSDKLMHVLVTAGAAAKNIAEIHGVHAESVPFITSLKKSL